MLFQTTTKFHTPKWQCHHAHVGISSNRLKPASYSCASSGWFIVPMFPSYLGYSIPATVNSNLTRPHQGKQSHLRDKSLSQDAVLWLLTNMLSLTPVIDARLESRTEAV